MSKKVLAFVSGLMPTATAQTLPRPGSVYNQAPPAEGTYAHITYEVAQSLGYAFVYIPIQDSININPTMTEMGQIVEYDIERTAFMHERIDAVITSSVGANALVQAWKPTFARSPQHLITLEGVFDALGAIKLQLEHAGHGQAYELLKAEEIPYIDLPVNGTNGTFTLTEKHLLDTDAVRLFDPEHQDEAIAAMQIRFPAWRPLPKLTNITAEKNRLCPPSAVEAFSKVMTPYVLDGRENINNIILPGDMVTQDQFRATLRQILAPAA